LHTLWRGSGHSLTPGPLSADFICCVVRSFSIQASFGHFVAIGTEGQHGGLHEVEVLDTPPVIASSGCTFDFHAIPGSIGDRSGKHTVEDE
jgi:hypothetical protein